MADFLSDEEQLTRLRNWWASNGIALIVGLVVVIGAVIGWRWYQNQSLESVERASDAYRAYLEARSLGAPSEALATAVETEYAGTAYHVFVLLHRARDAADEKDWEGARDALVLALEHASGDVLEDLVRVRLARVQVQLDDPDAALATLERVTGEGFVGEVAELTGDIYVARGENALAREAYQAAVDASQNSPSLPFLELKLVSVAKD